jgi:FixJ family two-component response regulator
LGRRAALIQYHTLEAELPAKTRISIIDDDEGFRESLTGLMRSLGFRVAAFRSAMDFLGSPNVRDTRCLIADVNMPGMSGIELYRRLVELDYSGSTILITAYPDDSVRTRALADGVVCYLSKPFDEDVLLRCVRAALEQASAGGAGQA